MFRSNPSRKQNKPYRNKINLKLNVDSLRKNHKEFIKNNRLILTSQQIFRSKKHNVFTEDVNKIVLSTDNDKRIQSIDSTETYVYGTNEEIIHEKEEI